MPGFEAIAVIVLIALALGYAQWRERRDEKHGRRQSSDAGTYAGDGGAGWSGGWGWGGDSCGGGDGGGCGGD